MSSSKQRNTSQEHAEARNAAELAKGLLQRWTPDILALQKDAYAVGYLDALEAVRSRLAVETSAPQAPIVWVVVADNGGISASGSYAPGLPPGNHDLYCVPEAGDHLEDLRMSELKCGHTKLFADSFRGPEAIEPCVWCNVHALEAELQFVRAERIQTDALCGELRERVHKLNNELTALRAELEHTLGERKELEVIAAQRNEAISTLGQDIRRLKNQLTAVMLERDAQAREIGRLNQTLYHRLDEIHVLKRSVSAQEAPQAPIACILVDDRGEFRGKLYAPGLPPGEHDLYCEPESTAPYLSDTREPGS